MVAVVVVVGVVVTDNMTARQKYLAGTCRRYILATCYKRRGSHSKYRIGVDSKHEYTMRRLSDIINTS